MDVVLKLSYSNDNGTKNLSNKITVDEADVFSKTKEEGEGAENKNWSASGSITGSIELKNLTIATEGTVFEGNTDYIGIYASSDVVYDLDVQGKIEGSYKICTIPVRIFPNPGVAVDEESIGWIDNIKPELTVDIGIYLVMQADGELEIKYTIDDASIGLRASKTEGVKPVKHNNGKTVEIDGKITVDAGLRVKGDLKVDFLQWNNKVLADPSVYVGAEANAEILDVNDGFEEYLPCVSLDVRGPIVKIIFAENSETPLYEMLDNLDVDKSKDIFTSDTAPLKKEWHVETDLDYKITMLNGGVENCTHVKEEELDELIEEQAKDKIDNAIEDEKNRIKDDLSQRIEDMINQWFDENCNGC